MKTLIFTASILLCSLVFAGANERKAMKTALKGIDEEVKWFYDDCGFKPKVTFEEKDLESFSSKDRTHSRVIFLAGAKCRDIVSSFRNYICSDKEALKGLKEVSEIVCVPNKEALTVEQISYKITIKDKKMTVLYDPINPDASSVANKNKEIIKNLF